MRQISHEISGLRARSSQKPNPKKKKNTTSTGTGLASLLRKTRAVPPAVRFLVRPAARSLGVLGYGYRYRRQHARPVRSYERQHAIPHHRDGTPPKATRKTSTRRVPGCGRLSEVRGKERKSQREGRLLARLPPRLLACAFACPFACPFACIAFIAMPKAWPFKGRRPALASWEWPSSCACPVAFP